MFLSGSEYSCIGCHSKWGGDITDRLMMISACVFVCGGVVGVVCCFENSRVCFCSIRFRHGMFVCCVVMMCIGETGCCDSALVPPFL